MLPWAKAGTRVVDALVVGIGFEDVFGTIGSCCRVSTGTAHAVNNLFGGRFSLGEMMGHCQRSTIGWGKAFELVHKFGNFALGVFIPRTEHRMERLIPILARNCIGVMVGFLITTSWLRNVRPRLNLRKARFFGPPTNLLRYVD